MPDAHFGAADSWWKTGLPVVSFIHLHQETQRGPLRELFPDGGMDGFTGVVQLIVTWQKICSLNGYGKLEIDPHDDVDGDDDGDDDGDGGGNGGGAVMMPINMIMTKKMFYRRCTYLSWDRWFCF